MRVTAGRRLRGILGLACISVVAVVWAFSVARETASGGSLDARAAAVESQVRCPVCPEPIPVSDVQNVQAEQMRHFIRARLRSGASPAEVLHELAAGYGTSILLAPTAEGFDLLAWAMPILFVCAGGTVLVVALRRWVSASSIGGPVPPRNMAASATVVLTPSSLEREDEERLHRALAARD